MNSISNYFLTLNNHITNAIDTTLVIGADICNISLAIIAL